MATKTNIFYVCLYSLWKEMTHKPSNVAAATNLFSSEYVVGITCFDECFFILCDNWKAIFFIWVYRYSEGFSNRYVAMFFERSVLKEVRVLQYLYNSGTMVTPNFRNKFYTCKYSLTNLIFWLRFLNVSHFSL